MKKLAAFVVSIVTVVAFVFANGNGEKTKTTSTSTKKSSAGCCATMTAKECDEKVSSCDDKNVKTSKKASNAKAEVKAETKTETANGGTK